MKIAILGTRGIPNHYGGFEQYAELLSVYLAQKGCDVSVYNAHNHPYQEKKYKGVTIIHQYDPEYKIGTAGQFIYDYNCIKDIRKKKFDLVYQLGYTSSAIFNFLLPKDSFILTNMDGMEWKRTKYNKYVQAFLKYSEKLAVKHADALIADSLGIKAYLLKKYNTDAFYSAYTANVPSTYSEEHLATYQLKPFQYHLIIARLEPENNIETIIKGYLLSASTWPLIIVGNPKNTFGTYLSQTYLKKQNIHFIGAIYQKDIIDSLRHFALLYFHGHSVGGTNPSLLEAMAAECAIIAHDNVFNKTVLENDALYFENTTQLGQMIKNSTEEHHFFSQAKINNLQKIKTQFNEDYVFGHLLEHIKNLLATKKQKN